MNGKRMKGYRPQLTNSYCCLFESMSNKVLGGLEGLVLDFGVGVVHELHNVNLDSKAFNDLDRLWEFSNNV